MDLRTSAFTGDEVSSMKSYDSGDEQGDTYPALENAAYLGPDVAVGSGQYTHSRVFMQSVVINILELSVESGKNDFQCRRQREISPS